ncbi:uncharacterized protein [Musca autumnalis]|uniref:uncharacterized protein n=1 Tax=Musca autumnalis TaxID=221902 RepID=UPI003CFB77C9
MTDYNALFLNGPATKNPVPPKKTASKNQNREVLDILQKVVDNQQNMEKKMDRITTELISVRNEIAKVKSTILRNTTTETIIMPKIALKTLEEYKIFEQNLENEETLKTFINELCSAPEKSFEKFVRNSWRKIFSDDLAETFSWRGTATKVCIRGSVITTAIRTAFKQRFPLDDSDFDRISQKHFQYAHDRVVKVAKYQMKKQKIDESQRENEEI